MVEKIYQDERALALIREPCPLDTCLHVGCVTIHLTHAVRALTRAIQESHDGQTAAN